MHGTRDGANGNFCALWPRHCCLYKSSSARRVEWQTFSDDLGLREFPGHGTLEFRTWTVDANQYLREILFLTAATQAYVSEPSRNGLDSLASFNKYISCLNLPESLFFSTSSGQYLVLGNVPISSCIRLKSCLHTSAQMPDPSDDLLSLNLLILINTSQLCLYSLHSEHWTRFLCVCLKSCWLRLGKIFY